MDGGVNAWNWGSGDPPELITFQNICEGVAFVLPTATVTFTPPTDTPQPTPVATLVPSTLPPQPTVAVTAAKNGAGSYIVYASILLVLGALIIYLIFSRGK
jgi:zinc transporter ZupT